MILAHRRMLIATCLLLAVSASRGLAADDDADQKSADARFEKLSAEAMKAPEKADWRALRRAFAETSHYQPYDMDPSKQVKAIAADIRRGATRDSEAALLKLMERERSMRLETVTTLVALYRKTDQPAKAERYAKIADAITAVLRGPAAGTSFSDAIEVLYIQEEYFLIGKMPYNGRAAAMNDEHHYDVFDMKPDGDKPARSLYFNTDLSHKALSKMIRKLK